MSEDEKKVREAEDEFALAMFNQLAAKAEPLLVRKLSDRGVEEFRDLPREEVKVIWREALLEATALYAPGADMDGMRRATAAFTNDRFMEALSSERAKSTKYGAFDPSRGQDVAILLAGFGLPVTPLDRKTLLPIGETAETVEEAERIFSRAKTAVVGYEPAKAPFFLAVTDCINTLSSRLRNDPRFAHARALMTRDGAPIPSPKAAPFKHGSILIARLPGDQLETLMLEDPSPSAGSILLIAGWIDEDGAHGTPAPYFMVPRRLLTELFENPTAIYWLTRPLSPIVGKAH